jgi:recA bacterial DNA recombination protein
MELAALRSEVERALGEGFPSPFAFPEPRAIETVPSGLDEIDALTGGLPRGRLTEISGPASSGRASFAISVLAQMTVRNEVCALVDSSDSFDPYSAAAAGARLERLLWVRCRNLEQTLKAADLILQGRGFGLVALDLGGISPRSLHRVPLSFWFRFQRAVEHTPTVLLLFDEQASAKSCASLVLQLRPKAVRWSTLAAGSVRHSYLLDHVILNAKAVRSRLPRALGAKSWTTFHTETGWNPVPKPSHELRVSLHSEF